MVTYITFRYTLLQSIIGVRACERSVSGAESGSERAENRVDRSGAVSGSDRKRWSGSGARSGNGAGSGEYKNMCERGADS